MENRTGEQPHPRGVASLLEAVADVSFPVSRERLLLEYGERKVEIRHGHPELLRVILLRCHECEEFSSVEDLLSQIEDFV
ncbi:MAG: hypothetical protein HY692_00295 [Cyanobacteria bacterium NC_groundwater_1444_Ag_S-0.65um_54_12]|nr:hypothetical protein [Cyanobacteria bacterium NC_groundwater_1444_Ag_S-0.65um_54_12]